MTETIKTIITADGSAHAAAFRSAADVVNGYYAKEKAAASKAVENIQGQINALRLQSTGYENLANSMRATQSLQEQAARLAASGAISEEKAIALLRERQALQQAIAAQEARASRIASPREIGLPGGGLAPLTPESLRQIDRQVAQQRELQRQTYASGQAGTKGAMGFLAFTQAVEDSQFGMQGVINNIPQMVMGFGGSAGLAGSLSLAAVAGYAAYKAMYRLAADPLITDWADRQAAGQKAYNAELSRAKDNIRRVAMEERIAADVASRRAVENRNLEKTLELDRARLAILDQQREKLDRVRQAQDMIIQARVRGGFMSEGSGTEFSFRLGQRRANDDIASSQQNINRLAAEYSRIWENIGANLTRYQQEKGRIGAAVQKDMESLAWMGAERARLQAMLENPDKAWKGDINRMKEELSSLQALINTKEEELASNQAKVRLMEELIDKTRQDGEESKKVAMDKINAEKARIESLKEQIKLMEELRRTEQQSQAADFWKAWQAAKAKSAETSNASREDGRALMDQAKMDPAQKQARAAFYQELVILQQMLIGNNEKTKQAREQLDLQEQAVQASKEWNVSQQLALQLLRQKKNLQDQMKAVTDGLPDRAEQRRVARQEARDERKRQARIMNDRENPLRPELLRRREEERRNRSFRDRMVEKKKDDDKPKPFEDRQLTLIEEINNGLKKLGLV